MTARSSARVRSYVGALGALGVRAQKEVKVTLKQGGVEGYYTSSPVQTHPVKVFETDLTGLFPL